MAELLFLSCWVRGFTGHNMLAHFEKVLRVFPFSKLGPEAVIRVYPIEIAEPPQIERVMEEIDVAQMVQAFREFTHDDTAYQVETLWDLWQQEDDWNLRPSNITLTLFGPLFPSELGEQIRVELGLDSQFLPDTEGKAPAAPVRSNVRSLLRFVEDVKKAVPVEKVTLWQESGESLSGRLGSLLAGERPM
jgi:hypothetical protein